MNPAPGGRPPGNNRPLIRRKKPQADPFFKGPLSKPAAVKPTLNGHVTPPVNGLKPAQAAQLSRASSPSTTAVPNRELSSGFTDPRVTAGGAPYKDYRLVTTKKDLLDGLRYHVLQVAGDKPLDIRKDSEFAKPARLYRRDPRALPQGQLQEKKEEDSLEPKDGMTADQREELNKRKEARQKEREANLAQIAPSQSTGGKKTTFKKKTQQVFTKEFSTEEKRRIQTNYEEKLPWILEDFENKHCLIGHHLQGSMTSNAAFVFEPAVDASHGKFRLVPIEKVYQFKPKREDLQKMSIEEVEAAMKKGGQDPEWLVRAREARLQDALRERTAKESRGLFSGVSTKDADAHRTGEEADLDFEEDFADDEEGDLFADKDEDELLAEKRIKEDQLQANFLDFKDLKEYDEAEERERREEVAKKKNFKGLRKALERRERNYNHGSDSDYESSTDSTDDEERAERERLKKEEEEARKSNLPSSGTNTPSGRREKHDTDRDERGLSKSTSSKSLKRTGSPNLSDASGTDVSTRRKKLKSKHLSSTQPTSSQSRPGSPANVPSSTSVPKSLDPATAKKRRRLGAGSDTENESAVMSDGKAAQRVKIKMRGSGATPDPPSPATPAARVAGATTIRTPTIEDIRKAVPSEGIPLRELLKVVVFPKMEHDRMMGLIKSVANYDKDKKLLFPKDLPPQ